MTTPSRRYFLDNPPTCDPVVRKAQIISYNFLIDLQRKCKRDYYPRNTDENEMDRMIKRASTILRNRTSLEPVDTTIQELDENPYIQGLWPYTITDLVSLPSINKTQLCYKIIVQLLCKTCGTHVIYFTTKNSFSKSAVSNLIKRKGRNPVTVMSRIHVYDICTLSELIAAYNRIKVHHMNLHKIGLVVIDGILTYFKNTVDEIPSCLNVPIMTKFFQSIKVLSIISKFPVLVTNDVKCESGDKMISPEAHLQERYFEYIDLRIMLREAEAPGVEWIASVFAPKNMPPSVNR